MASTWSALKVELQGTGDNSGTWGTLTNANLGDAVLGEAITGSATVDFASAADVTVTLTDVATTQSARNLRLNITESGAGVGYVGNLILGSGCQIEKFYLIRNNGTGVKTIKNTTGTGIAVAAGKATLVYNDGTNVVDVLNSFSSAILGAENAGSIIPFYFANQAAFPSATTYHGAIAHSHATNAMYFAHSNAWWRLLDEYTTVTPAQGGTGVANNATMTVTGSGNFAYTRTLTGTTNVTFPTTGTLSTLAGSETFTNKTLTTPIISSISNTGTLTLPTSTDTLVGRATTDTLTNKTLTNPTVTNYVETVQALGTVGASSTLALTTGTVLTATLTASTACTFTMPTATAGKSFILILTQAATGMTTATFTSVKFPGGTAPTITATASAIDILTFVANGTSWFGTYAQAFA